MSQPNSYAGVFTALKQIEDLAAAACAAASLGALSVHTFRPRGQINLPAIYNVLDPSQMQPVDTLVDRDELIIGARVAVRHGDADEESDQLLAIADIVRTTIDRGLKDPDNPLGALQARRLGVRPQADVFGEIPVFALEFPIRVRLDVLNPPTYP